MATGHRDSLDRRLMAVSWPFPWPVCDATLRAERIKFKPEDELGNKKKPKRPSKEKQQAEKLSSQGWPRSARCSLHRASHYSMFLNA